MHIFLLVLVFSGFSCSNAIEDPEFFEITVDRDHPEKVYEAFEQFKIRYQRKYKDAAETQRRMQNFIKSYNTIGILNLKSNESGYTSTFGINKFSDLSSKEFQQRLSNIAPSQKSRSTMKKASPFLKRHKRQVDELPDSVDLRYEKVNGRYIVGNIVKDQGSCACCWGFAVTAVAEAVYAANVGPFTYLSEQELCDCATPGSLGCTGGDLVWGTEYIMGRGLAASSTYKWDEHRANQSGMCVSEENKRVLVEDKFDYYFADRYNAEEEIMAMLVQWKSPVAASFAVGNRFRSYSDGVLVEQDCDLKGPSFHAGAIIGYGSERDYFGRIQKYWIVRNSWGPYDWGNEDGYFKVIRGRDWCGIESIGAVGGRIADHTHA
ncbi:Protein CBG12922 [Caenorhabditis briggsae]|uniref:Protein CBG12922 n=3 Tax=Caenorhabditis briggsae TaxID=6238 RepID=A8XGP2_CAEBR|nr:Protein CBG12922 [Caenorhabditis briggsae]ULT92533.1 hypothetical protein L3Y34_009960 [Caenorhabditis briggsae]CAP31816.2 Protein CBG12922 [Caenorhabditis briggsae]